MQKIIHFNLFLFNLFCKKIGVIWPIRIFGYYGELILNYPKHLITGDRDV